MKRLLRAEDCPDDMEVSLLLTDDRRIQELNKQYRNMDHPTDVLSFSQIDGGIFHIYGKTPPQPSPKGEGENSPSFRRGLGGGRCPAGPLGDIVISVETAVRQAEELGKIPEDEMDLLVGHGLLHLLGYDDATPESLEEMRAKVAAVIGEEAAR